jgi:hypothetical protein
MPKVVSIREDIAPGGDQNWVFIPYQAEVKPKRESVAWQWKVLVWLGLCAWSWLFWYGVARAL